MKRAAVLVSGSGTNLQALLDTPGPAEIALVVSNRADSFGLERARARGVPTVVLPNRKDREAYDAALVDVLTAHSVDVVCLAGFMRLVTPVLLDAFPWRVLNIHPALLPSFPGLHAQKQAFEHGVRVAGATVHFVDAGTDTGPIIAQGAVPVLPGDDADRLAARILRLEHRLYPMVLRWLVEGRLTVSGRHVGVDLPPGESTFWLDPSP